MRWITRYKPKQDGKYFTTIIDHNGYRAIDVSHYNGEEWDNPEIIAWSPDGGYQGVVKTGDEYIVTSITHSGRKGPRNEPVNDSKYDEILNAKVIANFSDIQQYEPFTVRIIGYLGTAKWTTSEVLGVSRGITTNGKCYYIVETANSIYRFDEAETETIPEVSER